MTGIGKRRVRNVLLFFPMVLLITFLSFAVVYFSPGDAGRILLREHLQRTTVTEEQGREYAEKLGIAGDFGDLYFRWLSRAVKGDFGTSLSTGKKVHELFWSKYKLTLWIAFLSVAFEIILSFPIALRAGMRPGGFCDRLISLWSVISFAIPAFWIGLVVLWVLAMKLHWEHAIGYTGFRSLLIPSFMMGSVSCGQLGRILRSKSREVTDSGFVEFARAQGLKERDILYYHVLPHVLPASIAVLVLDLSGFIGGAVLMEKIFNIPGFSGMLFEAIRVKDYVLISGTLFFIAIVICGLNLLADSIYPNLDARNRSEIHSGRGGALDGKS